MTTHPGGSEVMEPLPNPSVDEVNQETYPGPALLVTMAGPTTVAELPARHGAAFTHTATAALTKVLGGPDEKRKRVVLDAAVSFKVAFTPTGQGMLVHAGLNNTARLELTYIGPVYLATLVDPADVGVLVEYWAD
jgi:hypothetical protein